MKNSAKKFKENDPVANSNRKSSGSKFKSKSKSKSNSKSKSKSKPKKKVHYSPLRMRQQPQSLTKIKKTTNNNIEAITTPNKSRNLKTNNNSEQVNSKRKSKYKFKEREVEYKKLDEDVNKLWYKFVEYYHYEDTFALEPTDEKEKNSEPVSNNNINPSQTLQSAEKKEVDFSLKLQSLLDSYKIKQGKDYHLISNSEEGSYLLKHSKLWVIYIKSLCEKENLKFKDTHQIFNYALEYDVDEYLLFDFFITLTKEFDEEEVLDFDENVVPKKFVEIYTQNRDHILKTLKEEEDCLEENLEEDREEINKSNADFSFSKPKSNEEATSSEINSENLAINLDISNKCNPEISDIVEEQEKEKKEEDKSNLNTHSQEENKTENQINTDNNTTSIQQTNNLNNSQVSKSAQKNKPNANPNMLTFSSLHKYRDNTDFKKSKRNNNEFEASVLEPNVRNSGNFAILSLSAKSQDKLGHKYVLTPLKKDICNTYVAQDEADKDLQKIQKEYDDFLYVPYDNELFSKIQSFTEEADNVRKLSFGEEKENDEIVEGNADELNKSITEVKPSESGGDEKLVEEGNEKID